jgi:hypothetical protein
MRMSMREALFSLVKPIPNDFSLARGQCWFAPRVCGAASKCTARIRLKMRDHPQTPTR